VTLILKMHNITGVGCGPTPTEQVWQPCTSAAAVIMPLYITYEGCKPMAGRQFISLAIEREATKQPASHVLETLFHT